LVFSIFSPPQHLKRKAPYSDVWLQHKPVKTPPSKRSKRDKHTQRNRQMNRLILTIRARMSDAANRKATRYLDDRLRQDIGMPPLNRTKTFGPF
jgi:hypothetical protein